MVGVRILRALPILLFGRFTESGSLLKSNETSALGLESFNSCLSRFPLSAVNPTLLITAAGSQSFRNMLNADTSMFAVRSGVFKAPIAPFLLFTDNAWDEAHGREPIHEEDLPFQACLVDVFVADPGLFGMLKKEGPIDQFYDFAGSMEPCDQPLRVKSGKLLVRKLAAIRFCVNHLPGGTTLIWLDTDVTFQQGIGRLLGKEFFQFTNQYDISYMPFSTNKQWGVAPTVRFKDIESPYWRIESGIVVFTVSQASRSLMNETLDLYEGGLLTLVKKCLDDAASDPVCRETWFRRNVYLDDIFAFSLVLHKRKKDVKQGWLWMSPQRHYIFAQHLTRLQTPYTSPFPLSRYFHHNIGSGAYSSVFRYSKFLPESELIFEPHQMFNDSLEFRFPGASPDELDDEFWTLETLANNQRITGIIEGTKPRLLGLTPGAAIDSSVGIPFSVEDLHPASKSMFLNTASRLHGPPGRVDFAANDCLRRFPLTKQNPTLIISASGFVGFEKMLRADDQTSMFGSKGGFSKEAPAPFWLFTDNSWDEIHSRSTIKHRKLPISACLIDVFDAVPGLHKLVRRGGPIDQFYDFAGTMEPCDQPLRVKSGKLLVRKLAAIRYCLDYLPLDTTLIWVDLDVSFQHESWIKGDFYGFVKQYDVSYVPISTNKQWGAAPPRRFEEDIKSPYWRIQSGIVIFTVSPASRSLMNETLDLYQGTLLALVKKCLADPLSDPICRETWFRRNVYMDDVFAFSLMLHKRKKDVKQGWLWVGDKVEYPFAHVDMGQTPYTSTFPLESYFHHHIGSGTYGSLFRSNDQTVDPELFFEPHQMFNNSLEFRFNDSTPEVLNDELWTYETLIAQQRAQGFIGKDSLKPRLLGRSPGEKIDPALGMPFEVPTDVVLAERIAAQQRASVALEERLSSRDRKRNPRPRPRPHQEPREVQRSAPTFGKVHSFHGLGAPKPEALSEVEAWRQVSACLQRSPLAAHPAVLVTLAEDAHAQRTAAAFASGPAWLFHANSHEAALGQRPVDVSQLPPSACAFDVFAVSPALLAVSSAVDRFYDLAGNREPTGSLTVKRGHLTVRKYAALAFSLAHLPENTTVVWCDPLVRPLKPLDAPFFDLLARADVAFARKSDHASAESGALAERLWRADPEVLAFTSGAGAETLVHEVIALHAGGLERLVVGCRNRTSFRRLCSAPWFLRNAFLGDSFVLTLALQQHKGRARQVFFAEPAISGSAPNAQSGVSLADYFLGIDGHGFRARPEMAFGLSQLKDLAFSNHSRSTSKPSSGWAAEATTVAGFAEEGAVLGAAVATAGAAAAVGAVRRCLQMFPLDAAHPTVIVSSVGSLSLGRMALAPEFSMFGRREAPPAPFWLFTEDAWDVAHGRSPVFPDEVPFDVCIVDLFAVEPSLWRLMELGGPLDQFYDYAGNMEACDQPLKIKSGKVLVRKLAAVEFTARHLPLGTTVVWLDADVRFRGPLDSVFYDFTGRYDISYIPFTTNKRPDRLPKVNFKDIDSPYWRIESGIMVVSVSADSRRLFNETLEMYDGGLLNLAKECLEGSKSLLTRANICSEIWFQRNAYLDDIFVFSMLLHKHKRDVKQGWLWISHDYVYPHLKSGQTPYTSTFDLSRYFTHHIGHGAYSNVFRDKSKPAKPDAELSFYSSQRFNNTMEFRFPGATPKLLQDEYWPLVVVNDVGGSLL